MDFKKILKGGIALMMAATMFGCSGGSSTSETTTTTTDETTETAGAIKIGNSGPLTGGAAVYGIAVKNAIELAVEEINAMGGLQFEYNPQDDAHDAEKAVTAYGVLTDWGMQISLGNVTSTPMAAVAPMYSESIS